MLSEEKKPWAIQAFNIVNRLVDFQDNLEFDKLLRKARRNTGLKYLGDDFNEQSLRLLLQSISEEADLNPFGQLMIREKLISQLENRLWAEYWFAKHPEILEQETLPIILITGLQRTGTTKMQRLLSSLPKARGLYSWEALYPAPIGQADEIHKRIKRTRRNERAVRWISPTFQSIHPIHTDQPEEDVVLLDVHFMSTSSEAILNVPSYARWLEQQDQEEAYRYEKKLLKLLQWQRNTIEGAHREDFWVLKSPHHLQYLAEFAKVFPKSHIIWMHRDPIYCLPSYLSMLYYSRNMFVDKVNKEGIKEHWLRKIKQMLSSGTIFREAYGEKILDLDFQELISSERETINKILSFSNQPDHSVDLAVLMTNASGFVSKHKYNLADWDLTEDQINDFFAQYYHLNPVKY